MSIFDAKKTPQHGNCKFVCKKNTKKRKKLIEKLKKKL